MTEAEVMESLKSEVRALQCNRKFPGGDRLMVWRNNLLRAKRRGQWLYGGLPEGSADFIGVWDGMFVGIECKAAGGRVRDNQRRWIHAVNSAGGIAMVYGPEQVGDLGRRLLCERRRRTHD